MNLKNRIATGMSLLFMLFLGLIFAAIYLLFSNFRNEEFKGILNDRISTISNFVEEIKNKDETADLNLINNTPNYTLQQEQILIFNNRIKLIYSNIKDQSVEWTPADLQLLKRDGAVYRRSQTKEIYGRNVRGNYYLIQAEDVFGIKKLGYLSNLMMIFFILGSALVWVLSFLFARRMLAPLDDFQKKITNISVTNLSERLPENDREDEIGVLVKVFNTMLGRIGDAYSAQKEFTASASHEIKTPLARMAYQLENLSALNREFASAKYISGIRREVFQLSDTVDSLLILSKTENSLAGDFEEVRLDEVIFNAFEKVKRLHTGFEMSFSINSENEDGDLTVPGIKSLLEIVFVNLFKNAELYSEDGKAEVVIKERRGNVCVQVYSNGPVIPESERPKIFEAFRRGSNTGHRSGSGLGLRISKRIMDFHNADFSYSADSGRNVFILNFSDGRKE